MRGAHGGLPRLLPSVSSHPSLSSRHSTAMSGRGRERVRGSPFPSSPTLFLGGGELESEFSDHPEELTVLPLHLPELAPRGCTRDSLLEPAIDGALGEAVLLGRLLHRHGSFLDALQHVSLHLFRCSVFCSHRPLIIRLLIVDHVS